MAEKQINFDQIKVGEKLTLKLREGESVIVGTVTEETPRGNIRVALVNNRNSVVLTPATNFRIFADRGPTIQEILGDEEVGVVFSYRNKYGKTLTWVKTGEDRVTLVNDDRPAYSLSISAGFTDQGDAADRIEFLN